MSTLSLKYYLDNRFAETQEILLIKIDFEMKAKCHRDVVHFRYSYSSKWYVS